MARVGKKIRKTHYVKSEYNTLPVDDDPRCSLCGSPAEHYMDGWKCTKSCYAGSVNTTQQEIDAMNRTSGGSDDKAVRDPS